MNRQQPRPFSKDLDNMAVNIHFTPIINTITAGLEVSLQPHFILELYECSGLGLYHIGPAQCGVQL